MTLEMIVATIALGVGLAGVGLAGVILGMLLGFLAAVLVRVFLLPCTC